MAWLKPSELTPDPDQPRRTFEEASLLSLGKSMLNRVEQPLLVRKAGTKTFIVEGERRWRAAKLCKVKLLPCLLTASTQGIDVAATQLTVGIHREPLSTMDVAEFLHELRQKHKMSDNQLLAQLNERGIHNVGASKLDKYLSLMELPAWAKKLLSTSTFTEAHGAMLVGVAKFPEVMDSLKKTISDAIMWQGAISLKELQQEVSGTLRDIGIDLNRQHGRPDDIRAFPITQCKSCEFYKKQGGTEWCLNKVEWQRKQDEALLLKAAKTVGGSAAPTDLTDPTAVQPMKLKESKVGIVKLQNIDWASHKNLHTAEFDKGQCQTCPHRRSASHDGKPEGAEDTCFHPPCFNKKEKQFTRSQGKREKVNDYLDGWLRANLKASTLRFTQPVITGLIHWLAMGAVDRRSDFHHGQRHPEAANATEKVLKEFKLNDLPEVMNFSADLLLAKNLDAQTLWETSMVNAAINVVTNSQLRWLWKHLNMRLDDPSCTYFIDAEYLAFKSRAQLGELLKLANESIHVREAAEPVESIASMSVLQMREKLLELPFTLGVGIPQDVQELFDAPLDAPLGDDDEFFSGDDDDEGTDDDDLDAGEDGVDSFSGEETIHPGRVAKSADGNSLLTADELHALETEAAAAESNFGIVGGARKKPAKKK